MNAALIKAPLSSDSVFGSQLDLVPDSLDPWEVENSLMARVAVRWKGLWEAKSLSIAAVKLWLKLA